jgi:hypothetical protein
MCSKTLEGIIINQHKMMVMMITKKNNWGKAWMGFQNQWSLGFG